MSNLRSIKRAMEKAAAKDAPQSENTPTKDGSVSVEVDGETPQWVPAVGDVVIASWGDPNLIGGALVELPLFVTSLLPGHRVCGQIVTDPQLVGMGPGGRQQSLPASIPIVNMPYARTPRAMTWRYRDLDDAVRQVLAAIISQQPVTAASIDAAEAVVEVEGTVDEAAIQTTD